MREPNRTLRDRPERPGIRASLIVGTVVFAVGQGVPMERITEATGLRPSDLTSLDGWLPEIILPTVWRVIAETFPGRAMALEMGKVAPLSVFGPLAYVCRNAPDMRTLVHAFIRYSMVLSDHLEVTLVEGPREAEIRVRHPMDAEDGGHAAEMGLAITRRFGGEYMPYADRGMVRVEFSHAPLGPRRDYEAFFGVPVRFERPANCLVFRAEALDRAIMDPDPSMFRFIQEHLDRVRAQMIAEDDASDLVRIRAAVAENAERCEYGAEALARRLGMSLRKVQRVARAHGTTVRALLEQAREANARQLLGDRRLSIEEVSFLLGYSEDRAFRRAFKRWTGATPAELRRALC